ncbi:MAG: cupin domain-containing protein [Solirubrobacterales bacterium]
MSLDRNRRLRSRRPILIAALALALLAVGAAAGWALQERQASTVVREPLAQSSKVREAKGQTLGLTRVTLKPGAQIAPHHHPGTQVSYIDEGTLTYTVLSGSVTIRKGPSDDHPKTVRKVEAGETARIKAGQWIVEQPNEHHQARNAGDGPVVIYLSTLFPKGAPPSIPDDPDE